MGRIEQGDGMIRVLGWQHTGGWAVWNQFSYELEVFARARSS